MRVQGLRGIHALVFDVGETLVDESRAWAAAASDVGITPLTLMAQLGSIIERGLDHRQVWSELGVKPAVRAQIEAVDLYPDALPCLQYAKSCGFTIGIAGNQPDGAIEQLSGLGFDADFVASSSEWEVEKPSPIFFEKVIAAARVAAETILYVGDRLDNDFLPARQNGMKAALLMRGPWAHITALHADKPTADLQLASLEQLRELLE